MKKKQFIETLEPATSKLYALDILFVEFQENQLSAAAQAPVKIPRLTSSQYDTEDFLPEHFYKPISTMINTVPLSSSKNIQS